MMDFCRQSYCQLTQFLSSQHLESLMLLIFKFTELDFVSQFTNLSLLECKYVVKDTVSNLQKAEGIRFKQDVKLAVLFFFFIAGVHDAP